jgi:ribulose-5-phosphate 4-epimerase/fuculose-1-phosphate aldolase
MASRKEAAAARDIIAIGRAAYARNLVAARAGNLSIRLGAARFMITGQGAALGFLRRSDLIIADLEGRRKQGTANPSFETGLHAAIYKSLNARAIVHLHPPCALALTEAKRVLLPITFEAELFLGAVPVIPQEAPNVIDPSLVVAALSLNTIVMLKNHGVVSTGETLQDAFFLAELLEESSRMNILSYLLQAGTRKAAISAPAARRRAKPVTLFSPAHCALLEKAVNAKRLMPLSGTKTRFCFGMRQDDSGREYAVMVEPAGVSVIPGGRECSLKISGSAKTWTNVFNGRMNLFTAVIQKKMALTGSLQELLRWYPLLNPLFKIWQTIPIIA